MAELSLDDVHWFAFGCEFGRERVTQTVRVDSLLNPGLRSESLHQVSDIARVDRLSLERAEQTRPPR